MKNTYIISLLLFVFAFFALGRDCFSQKNIDPSSVNVSALTDAQVKKIVDQMEKNGMSLEQAISMARMRGASQSQIDQMVQKIKDYKRKKQFGEDEEMPVDSLSVDQFGDEFSEKKEFLPEEKNKKIFGFHFFNSEKLNFTPNINVPVSDSYSLGIDDQLLISIYGASQKTYSLNVEKDGCIHIPDLGPVSVYGIPFEKVKENIKQRLIAIYNGMQGENPNTFASVNIGRLKGIKVNVIGDVNVPGTYTVPATSSVFNVLYLAGGPNKNGTFRNIQVIRNDKIVSVVDVYEYLIDGKTQSNIQLRNQDIILINPYLNRIAIEGEFKRSGLFEAKNNETVEDLIRYAGGFKEKAYTNRLDLYRNNSRTKSFLSVSKKDYTKQLVANGDSLVAGEIVDRFENRVVISGAVYRPGNYELKEGMKLSDLIKDAEGIRDDAFMERGVLTRKKDDLSLESISFSLKKVMLGQEDYTLKREDQVQISSIFDIKEARTVEVLGEVQFPGTYAWAENLKIADLIFKAGGFKESAEVANVEVSRVLDYNEISKLSKNLLHTYQAGVDRNLKVKADDENFMLMPFDKVYIRRSPGYREQQTVTIQGEVKFAGAYGITRKNEKLSDIVKRSGGLTPEAYLKGASLRRRIKLSEAEYQAKLALVSQDSTMSMDDIKKDFYQVVGIDLVAAMENPGCNEDLQVMGDDQILVPSKLETVTVSGAVLNPVSLTYTKNMSLKQYIRMSGGFSNVAKRGNTYVVYANGTSQATRGGLFGRRYPKIEPGCQVVVPKKPQIDRAAMASTWMAIASTFASLITAIAIATR